MRTKLIAAIALLGFTACIDGAGEPQTGELALECGGRPEKVTICHIPPGNPDNAHTISVSASAVRAHLAHGDHLGECAPTCAPEAAMCAVDDDCCLGACLDGVCTTACAPGSTSACYGGPAGTAGIGECRDGAATCDADGSGYGACSGDITPTAETCGDGLDNDCDGAADEGCVCVPGAAQACYDGPAGTEGVGACVAGSQTCLADGSGYTTCVGAIAPSDEVCGDGVDNDCDGEIDDGCGCIPQPEACGDGVDNDCDDAIDEGCIGDRVWLDANRDGLQSASEAGFGGVTLLLRSAASGALVAVTTSTSAGTYYFAGVPAGTYYIEVIRPATYSITDPDVGTDDTIDNDFDGEIDATAPFTYAGNAEHTIDCGLRPPLGGT